MNELTEQQRQEPQFPEPVVIDEYDPDEGAVFINEVMAEDDAADPLLESYQHYGQRASGQNSCLRRERRG